MRTARTGSAAQRIARAWRAAGETIGFVPTMGALHEGHRSLLRKARRSCDRLVASIFVNPLQFGPNEDYRRYPRPLARDKRILEEEGADLLFLPRPRDVYPPGYGTVVSVPALAGLLEGHVRPGHFDGIATVVAKLLLAAEPDRLYLGQKDAQQAALLARMVADLGYGCRVVVCPTIRERDGLACSSRNAYLSVGERAWAPSIYRALRETRGRYRDGAFSTPQAAARHLGRRLSGGPGTIDYAAAVDPATFGPPSRSGPFLLAVAYRMPSTRLIDNIRIPGRERG